MSSLYASMAVEKVVLEEGRVIVCVAGEGGEEREGSGGNGDREREEISIGYEYLRVLCKAGEERKREGGAPDRTQ
jgi:hypothetical protein